MDYWLGGNSCELWVRNYGRVKAYELRGSGLYDVNYGLLVRS